MTFEPVFASVFAVGLGGEALTVRLIVGGILILLATFVGIHGGRADRVDPDRATLLTRPTPVTDDDH